MKLCKLLKNNDLHIKGQREIAGLLLYPRFGRHSRKLLQYNDLSTSSPTCIRSVHLEIKQ
jgi:hypothetical protein